MNLYEISKIIFEYVNKAIWVILYMQGWEFLKGGYPIPILSHISGRGLCSVFLICQKTNYKKNLRSKLVKKIGEGINCIFTLKFDQKW